jgi:hypothetical protein
MPKLGKSGSVRGALSNERPYRDQAGTLPVVKGRLGVSSRAALFIVSSAIF